MRILLIMPNFFEYPRIIIDELNHMGYDVDYYNDRPSDNPFIKAIIRIKKNALKPYINRYFKKILRNTKHIHYDYVFLISGQSLSFDFHMMNELKQSQSKAKWRLYQWDSLANFPSIAQMHKLFDECYSFDPMDVKNYSNLILLPLFYCQQYEDIGKTQPEQFQYDFCFIGTAHPKKYRLVKEMSEKLKYIYPKQFIYLYYPSRIVYVFWKFKSKDLKASKLKDFHFVPLSSKKIYDIYNNSRCILDSSQAGQMGLTIRTIETLGANRKLITTNEDIMNYDFYQPENIYVYNGKFDIHSVFFDEKYKEIDEQIYQKYSLRNWLKEILK